VLACVPGEHHELSLLAFGVALRRRSWRITYLGTDSPIGAIADTSRTVQPAVVVLLSMNPEGFLDHAPEIGKLAGQVPVMIAGPGATPEAARQTHTQALAQDPVSAAAIIDRDYSAPR
jgi:methanogenic corrinoid protein MtbC1